MDARVMAMRMERWREIIVACNTSGMKKKEWLQLHNISPKMFYRKQKELREWEMLKAGITAADIPAGQKPAEFFDLTTAITNQRKEISVATEMRYEKKEPRIKNPEVVIQAGPYNLYIGNDITEKTLATVLKVIGNA